ncbi:ACH1 Acetyl-CoA hydrolase [Rhabdaerophilaceae bacterium]
MAIAIKQHASGFDFATVLKSGDTIAWPQGTGEPLGLTRRLVSQRQGLPKCRLFVGMTTSDTLTPTLAESFEIQALNGAGSNRRMTSVGLLDITPVHVSSVPALLRAGAILADVVLLRVRPTGQAGQYSLGVVCDYTAALIEKARCVIGEVDERLPMTGQDALVSANDIDVLVAADNDEILMQDADPSPVELEVARHVASLIPDRATVQLGIGGLAVAVSRALFHHKDLGVHTGVLSDVFVDMVEHGAISNAYKGADTGISVTGCLFGSRRLNDFVSNNREFAMRSVEYTHQPFTMARINALHSINFAIEVDVTGQVNAEIAAGRYLGAVGGQASFVRGSQISPGGRSIIAFPSTTPDGKTSRIVQSLNGNPVTTTRSDVDAIVTEFGVAHLRGASFSERRKRLAAIAHPAFRDELLTRTLVPALSNPVVLRG